MVDFTLPVSTPPGLLSCLEEEKQNFLSFSLSSFLSFFFLSFLLFLHRKYIHDLKIEIKWIHEIKSHSEYIHSWAKFCFKVAPSLPLLMVSTMSKGYQPNWKKFVDRKLSFEIERWQIYSRNIAGIWSLYESGIDECVEVGASGQ